MGNNDTSAKPFSEIYFVCFTILLFIGIIGSVIFINVHGIHTEDNRQIAKLKMINIKLALELYDLEYNKYPTTEDGLKVLLNPSFKTNNPYLARIPEDPWENPFYYRSNGTTYELICYGADGKEGGKGEDADIKFLPDHP